MHGENRLMRDIWNDLSQLRLILAREDKIKFVLLFALMFVGSLIDAIGVGAIPVFISILMDPTILLKAPMIGGWFAGISDQLTSEIMIVSSVVLGLFVTFKNAFLAFVFYCQNKIAMSQWVKMADRMFHVYQKAPYDWHLQRSSSELLRNIQGDTSNVIKGYILSFMSLVMGVLMTSFIFFVLVLGAPSVAFGSVVIMGLGLFVVIRLFQGRLRTIGLMLREAAKEITQAVLQGFGALVDARIIGCEKHLRQQHYAIMMKMANGTRNQLVIMKSLPLAIETIATFGLLVVLYLLFQTTESPAQILPIIAMLGVATIRLKQTTTAIGTAIGQMNSTRAFIPGIVNDLKELRAIERTVKRKSAKAGGIGKFSALKLKNISYKYPNTDSYALRNVSLTLKQGQSIAFVGSTGCGKSTMVNVLLGLLEPQEGKVLVNKQDIFSSLDSWRAHLGYIPQSIYLLDDTIRANIAFGVPDEDIDEETLWSAIQSANLDSFITSLPDGVSTEIGENGARLSGGQQQRLGIARALYFNPDVLVMDEATSALDNNTEKEVMQAIQGMKQNRTLIMIAHRLSTVEDCDCLYFLDAGRISHSGTFEELKRESPKFRKMAGGRDENVL